MKSTTPEKTVTRKLIKHWRSYAVRWRTSELEKLAMAGLAARAAHLAATGREPCIEELARITFNACTPILWPAGGEA